MRGRSIASLCALALGCSGRAAAPPPPASPARALAPPTLGAALPTTVLAVDPDLRWAVMCQGQGDLYDAELGVFTTASPRQPIRTLRGFVTASGTRIVGVVEDRLVLIDAVDGSAREVGPAFDDHEPVAAAVLGDTLLVGRGQALAVHDLATGSHRLIAAPGRIVAIEPVGARFAVTLARDGDGNGRVHSRPEFAVSCGDPIGPVGGGIRGHAGPPTDLIDHALVDPAAATITVAGPGEFISSEGLIHPEVEGCETLGLLDDPFRLVARCKRDGYVVFVEDGDAKPLPLPQDSSPIAASNLRVIAPAGRVWCAGERCIDLFDWSPLPHVLAVPWWVGNDYALDVVEGEDEDQLYAIGLADVGRAVIADARTWSYEDDNDTTEVEASAGDIVALRDEVIDLAQHRVVSAGPWEFHAVLPDGTAIVTNLEDDEPLRQVPPGTFER